MALLGAWFWAIAILPATALIKPIWARWPDAMPTGLQGRFKLDGKIHQLTLNEHGRTHLHGGRIGLSRRGWLILQHTDASVTLGLTSPAGEEGYPGTLEASCTYRLVDPGTLSIHMTAETDSPTIVNSAQHSYFTLNYGQSIRDHLLQIDAEHYTPTDGQLIPTGAIVSVTDTPFDFRRLRRIAEAGISYDINFVLHHAQAGLHRAARLLPPDGGIALEVYTTEAGLQFYDGGYLKASHPGLDGCPHFPHAGLCLEPGRFPDGPNHPNFPSPVLRPGEVYRQTTEYRFVNAD
jgi:aldose 1-epimerase